MKVQSPGCKTLAIAFAQRDIAFLDPMGHINPLGNFQPAGSVPALQRLGKVDVDLAGGRNALLFLESSNRALCFRTHYPVNTPAVEPSPGKCRLDRARAVVLRSAPVVVLVVVASVVSVPAVGVIGVIPIITPSPPGIPVKREPGSVTVVIATMVKKAPA